MKKEELMEVVKHAYNTFVAEYPLFPFNITDIFSIIEIESSWNPEAESPYARGLMQISKVALKDVNRLYNYSYTYDDLFDPFINVIVGLCYLHFLKKLVDKYVKSTYPEEYRKLLVIMAYNWGIGNVRALLETAPDNKKLKYVIPEETKDYVTKFLFWKHHYIIQA